MQPTPYPHVNAVLDDLLTRIKVVLGDKLVGVYLSGSLVTGSYDDDVSDIDLLAATASDVDDEELERLRVTHHELVASHPQWDDRIEVAYLSVAALRTFKTHTSRLAIISPGEPLHAINAGRDWLMNWYLVREADVALFGPPPRDIIAPIAKDEYVDAVREHARAWGEGWGFLHDRGTQSYAVLTMCRALYTHRTGEHTSKAQAAAWAQHELPEWADLIRDALALRTAPRQQRAEPSPTLCEAMHFVNAVKEMIAGECSTHP
jgi:aminoglycoside adenylyltransferase-like protein/nucleotidyltransferase-like protein